MTDFCFKIWIWIFDIILYLYVLKGDKYAPSFGKYRRIGVFFLSAQSKGETPNPGGGSGDDDEVSDSTV